MCGICGIVGPSLEEARRNAITREMIDTLRHRGPDGQGFMSGPAHSLAHTRLAIIDLQSGTQPMRTEDGRFTIVFNGEIYNYLELRQELIRGGAIFKTHSDTEVLLQLWAHKGPAALSRLNGMFAFAVYDSLEKTVTLVRDHFGIKPLYYCQSGDDLVFASEIKALLRHPDITASASRDGIAEYLVFQFCLGGTTMFDSISKLEPGYMLTYRTEGAGAPELHQWWKQSYVIDTHHTEEYFNDSILLLLQNAIDLQLRSDVPVGAYLSGGLDSSTVATLAARAYGNGFHCFTGRFAESAEYDESEYARIVAKQAGGTLHVITPTAADFVSRMPSIIYALDEPVAGPGVFPQFMVSELAKQHVTVVLGGQGGDEVFGGYARYLVAYLEQALKGAILQTQHNDRFVLTLESIIPNLPVLQKYIPMMREFMGEGLFDPVAQRYMKLVARNSGLHQHLTREAFESIDMERITASFGSIFNAPESASSINRMLHFDQKTLLPALLHIEDRASMAVSLESRVPLLDHRLVELANAMPPTIKLKAGELKHSFKKAVTNLLPAEIGNRKDKMGFPVPLGVWCKKGEVRDFVFDLLGSNRARHRGIYAPEALDAILNDPNPYGRKLWGMLNLELWFRTFIDR